MALLASEVPRVGCGCFLLSADHPGKALFGKRKGSHGAGRYALPGGKLELDELIEECIVREIKEEVNVDITCEDVVIVGTTNDRRLDGDNHKHYITFHCRAIIPAESAPVENMEPNKCAGWEWMTYADIHALWEAGKASGKHTLFEPTQRLLATGLIDTNFWAHLVSPVALEDKDKVKDNSKEKSTGKRITEIPHMLSEDVVLGVGVGVEISAKNKRYKH